MSRGASPIRFDRTGEINALDVDPEAVRMALRDFVQQLAGAERERVRIHCKVLENFVSKKTVKTFLILSPLLTEFIQRSVC